MKKKNKKNKVLDVFCNTYLTFFIYCIIGWLYEVIWIYLLDGKLTNRGFLFGPYLPIYGFGMLLLLVLLRKLMNKKLSFSNYLSIPTLLVAFLFIFIVTIEFTVPRIYKISSFFECFAFPLVLYLAICLIFILLLRVKLPLKTQDRINIMPILIFILIFIITTLVEYVSHYMLDTKFNILLWDYSKDFLNYNRRVCFDASRNFAIGGTFLLYVVQPRIEKLFKKIGKRKKLFYTCLFGFVMLTDFILKLFVK